MTVSPRPFAQMVFCLISIAGSQLAVAQDVSPAATLHDPCSEMNHVVRGYAASGNMEQVEIALSRVLASGAKGPGNLCAAQVLADLAAAMIISGRLAEAEVFAGRSLNILEKTYPRDDLVLLHPLQVLAAAQFEQRKTAKARASFQRMLAIRITREQDRALVHGMAASLLQAEGRLDEAEREYRLAHFSWEQAGRGETVDAAAILNCLGYLYMERGKLSEARKALDRALAIFMAAEDAVPMDRVKLLGVRASLYGKQGEWNAAADDLAHALSIAERETRLDPVAHASLLIQYASVLRKTHRKKDAQSIEARAALLRGNPATDAVVDVTELLPNAKIGKK